MTTTRTTGIQVGPSGRFAHDPALSTSMGKLPGAGEAHRCPAHFGDYVTPEVAVHEAETTVFASPHRSHTGST